MGLGRGEWGEGLPGLEDLTEFDATYFEFGLGMRFYDRFLQIRRPENFPTRPPLVKFGLGEGGMGGGATRIGGLEQFDDTYFEFGLGMRFYEWFLQIRHPENVPA